jgi:hypothetical protein
LTIAFFVAVWKLTSAALPACARKRVANKPNKIKYATLFTFKNNGIVKPPHRTTVNYGARKKIWIFISTINHPRLKGWGIQREVRVYLIAASCGEFDP